MLHLVLSRGLPDEHDDSGELMRARSAGVDECAVARIDGTRAQGYGERRVAQLEQKLAELEAANRVLVQQNQDLAGTRVQAPDLLERRERVEEQLVRRAFYDTLTALPNRVRFTDQLGRALARAGLRRHGVAVLFLDLDRFNVINCSLGYDIGDELLVAVGQQLAASLASADLATRLDDEEMGDAMLARLGGDAFGIALEELHEGADAIRMAERIGLQLQRPFVLAGHEIFVTASLGIARSRPESAEPQALLRDADVAMRRAKDKGGACYVVFEPAMNVRTPERLHLESALRNAVGRGELSVHYQPIVQLDTGRIVGLEALARWERPAIGMVSPAEFIPVAEETGLILSIGQWVLQEASRKAQVWQSHLPHDPSLRVAVNLSARQFQQQDLMLVISTILRETGLAPESLELEITESVVMQDAEAAAATLEALKGLGVRLAIDDFGTGYSSLAYLKRFPIDTLKIDRAFIKGLGVGAEDQAIVRATITLAHALGLEVTAEGIETAAQLEALRTMGCDLGQGYYMAKPVAGEDLSALLERSTLVPV